jgi:hypothetical protein
MTTAYTSLQESTEQADLSSVSILPTVADRFYRLRLDSECDQSLRPPHVVHVVIVVIGSGMMGLAIAQQLKERIHQFKPVQIIDPTFPCSYQVVPAAYSALSYLPNPFRTKWETWDSQNQLFQLAGEKWDQEIELCSPQEHFYSGYENGPYVNKHWGTGSPASGCPNDNFSARFTSTPNFGGGDYRFHCQHDDGCRIYIDGQLRLDAWWSSSFDGHDWGGYLSPGNHEVRIELFEGGGDAEIEAWWQGPGYLPRDEGCDPATQWCFEGYGNRNIRGTSWIRRGEGTSAALDHQWGSGGFGYGMSSDDFSARYTRTLDLTCGRYRFNVSTDDGVKLWANNNLILDRWQDQHTSYAPEVDLPGGPVPPYEWSTSRAGVKRR